MNINKTWPLSAMEQLKAQLRLAIRTGSLRAGNPLPTVRALASKLALNPNTVAAVYRDLAREGLVTKHRRGGTRVVPGPLADSAGEQELHAQVDRLIRLAQRQHRDGGEVLRLLAGRWSVATTGGFGAHDRYPLYGFLQQHDYDQG